MKQGEGEIRGKKRKDKKRLLPIDIVAWWVGAKRGKKSKKRNEWTMTKILTHTHATVAHLDQRCTQILVPLFHRQPLSYLHFWSRSKFFFHQWSSFFFSWPPLLLTRFFWSLMYVVFFSFDYDEFLQAKGGFSHETKRKMRNKKKKEERGGMEKLND